MTGNSQYKASDVLKSLHEFIIGPEEDVAAMPMEQVNDILKSEGIDPTSLIKQVKQRIIKVKAEQELAEARQKRMDCVSKLQSHGATVTAGVKERVRAMIENLMPGSPELATVYFRKFEEANEEDLASLLDDLEALELLKEEDAGKTAR